ncbi:MAG: hypothetical protein NTU61_00070 [Candidatus Altiarchaeota archaeon]|nr:hypothetical protein [Candidatus Altiarchaeota archaeon]
MFKKGQSAMEYLMTYGWAIMVVMVAGIALWRLGVLNIGSTAPPTATGFTTIKPIMSSCELTGDTSDCPFGTSCSSMNHCAGIFKCTFLNEAGAPIRITNLRISTERGPCGRMWMSKSGRFGGSYDWRDGYCYVGRRSQGSTCSNQLYRLDTDSNYYNYWTVNKDEMFVVLARRCPPSIQANYGGDCCGFTGNVAPIGDQYAVTVDFEYEITIGGITSEKHSVGTIRGRRAAFGGTADMFSSPC